MGDLNDRSEFSHRSGGENSKNRVPTRFSSHEDSLPGLQMAAFLLYAQCTRLVFPWCMHIEGARKLSGVSAYQGNNPIIRALLL